jgi:hypothetical protein
MRRWWEEGSKESGKVRTFIGLAGNRQWCTSLSSVQVTIKLAGSGDAR